LSAALRLATRRAVNEIHTPFHEVIIDGTVNFLRDTPLGRHATTLPKADALIPAVSAASIVAKVARDQYMTKLAAEYPGYGFESHVGYGTAKHRAALEQLGATPEHRRSFRPVADITGAQLSDQVPPAAHRSSRGLDAVRHHPSTTHSGREAETVAADYLARQGHIIIARNWRTPRCEIDLVSTRGDRIYFTEVKYRRRSTHGDGLAAITPAKQKQLRFAAEIFQACHRNLYKFTPVILCISASGAPPRIDRLAQLD
jgi:ribonuclease HII